MLTSQVRKPEVHVSASEQEFGSKRHTHVSKISVEHFDITMDDFKRHELVVRLADAAHEEQGSVSSVDDLGICGVL